MKNFIVLLTALLSFLSYGYEQFTQIGEASIDVRKQGLQQNVFRRDEKLEGARRIQACESIDNSMMVVFCDMIPASTLDEWFGDAGIRNSLQELLRRGGVIYIGWNSWSTFNSPLIDMRKFFADNGIEMTPASSIADFPHPKVKDYEKYAYAAKGCDVDFMRKPFDFTDETKQGELRVMANRWYRAWDAAGMDDLFVTKDGQAVIRAQRGILGKGTVITSMGFTVLRQPESPLIVNLINYAYGERKPLSDRELAVAEINRLMGGNTEEKYLVWIGSPYNRMYSTSLPKRPVDATELSVTVARNEKESLAFFVTNVTDKSLTFRLEPEPDTFGFLGDSENYYTDLLTIKEVLPRMNQLGEPQLDAICELNQAGVVTVPAYETRMFWIDVKTMLPAGKYDFTLELVPTATRDARKRVHVAVEVLEYTFPDELRPQVFGFGPYNMTFADGGNRIMNYIDFFGRNHLNHIITGPGCPKQAIKKDDATGRIFISDNPADFEVGNEGYCFAHGFKWFHSYGCYFPFMDTLKEFGMKDASIFVPEARALFEEFLRKWADSYRVRKIPFDRFYVGICDEVSPDFYDEYIAIGKCIKENAPEFRIFGTIATWVDGMDWLEKFDEFMDLWIPWEPRLTDRPTAAKELALYQRPENAFMPYLCSVGLHLQPLQSYFRFRGMRTFLMKSDKFSLWGFNSWRGNPWFSSATPSDNSFMFYNGDQNPIPTPRLEAFREGIEDMHMLLEAQDVLEKNANSELKSLIDKKTLNDVMSADDPERTASWRTALLRALDAAK